MVQHQAYIEWFFSVYDNLRAIFTIEDSLFVDLQTMGGYFTKVTIKADRQKTRNTRGLPPAWVNGIHEIFQAEWLAYMRREDVISDENAYHLDGLNEELVMCRDAISRSLGKFGSLPDTNRNGGKC